MHKKTACPVFLMVSLILFVLTACGKETFFPSEGGAKDPEYQTQSVSEAAPAAEDSEEHTNEPALKSSPDVSAEAAVISPEGSMLKTRFLPPEGYARVPAAEDSLTEFLRNYPLKEEKSPVLLYDGSRKRNQNAHAAVFALPIENEDLQQCADSILRVYAEYFWETGQYEKIAFHFVNGFLAEYTKWRDGYRIAVNGNDAAWEKTASYEDSYEAFVAYLRMVFAYAGTLSMESEAEAIGLDELTAGDVFLQGGSPGHVVLVVDVCENAEGKKAFLLGQGYMPAQEFHVLKNPAHIDDPWYYEEEAAYPFVTPEYTFAEGSLKRLVYGKEESLE